MTLVVVILGVLLGLSLIALGLLLARAQKVKAASAVRTAQSVQLLSEQLTPPVKGSENHESRTARIAGAGKK